MLAEVLPGLLWLGDKEGALDVEELRARGIRMVVNAASADVPSPFTGEMEYLQLPLDDTPDDPVLPYVYAICEFVQRAADEGCGCLVHCEMGRSRAAVVTMVYLIRCCDMSLHDAYELLVSVKPDVLPNSGFISQLRILERRVRGSVSSIEPGASPPFRPVFD